MDSHAELLHHGRNVESWIATAMTARDDCNIDCIGRAIFITLQIPVSLHSGASCFHAALVHSGRNVEGWIATAMTAREDGRDCRESYANKDSDAPRRIASMEHCTNQAQIRLILGADKARIKHRYTQINYNP